MTFALCILAYILIGFLIGCFIVYYHEEWYIKGVETVLLSTFFWLPLTPIAIFLFIADKAVERLHELHKRRSK